MMRYRQVAIKEDERVDKKALSEKRQNLKYTCNRPTKEETGRTVGHQVEGA